MMALDPNLIASIEQSIKDTVSPLLTSPSKGADLYELYIWSLIIEAARAEGATVTFYDVNGSLVTSNFVFRTSPGRIFSTIQPYTHALIAFPGCPALEAHIGIFVSGKSKVIHECDVAVLYADAAATCRAEEVHPKSTQLLLSAECKFYVQSSMGVGLARSYLGLVSEVKHTYRACYFVAVSESNSVQRLFAHHQKDWETGHYGDSALNNDRMPRVLFDDTAQTIECTVTVIRDANPKRRAVVASSDCADCFVRSIGYGWTKFGYSTMYPARPSRFWR